MALTRHLAVHFCPVAFMNTHALTHPQHDLLQMYSSIVIGHSLHIMTFTDTLSTPLNTQLDAQPRPDTPETLVLTHPRHAPWYTHLKLPTSPMACPMTPLRQPTSQTPACMSLPPHSFRHAAPLPCRLSPPLTKD